MKTLLIFVFTFLMFLLSSKRNPFSILAKRIDIMDIFNQQAEKETEK